MHSYCEVKGESFKPEDTGARPFCANGASMASKRLGAREPGRRSVTAVCVFPSERTLTVGSELM